MNFTKLTAFLDSLPDVGIPGVDCIVKKGYDTVYRHQAGYADREKKIPMSGNEKFFLYSSSKPITCTAVLQLYEQGKILLTDPVYEYIPEFRNMKVLHARGNGETCLKPAENPITVSNLLTMSSGLDYNLSSPAIQTVQAATNGEAPTLEVIRSLASQPLCFEPGTRWQYSLSHDVLGALIEVVSGRSFGSYLKEHIFLPLGMDNTGFEIPSEHEGRMMAQYCRNHETGVVSRIELKNEYILGTKYESGGAGLISTVDDYSRFTAAMANGGFAPNGQRILSQATINLMRTNHLNHQQMQDFNWPQFVGYGYGLGVRTLVDRARGGANSPVGEFGWGGASGSYVLIDPDHHISMFYAQHMRESMECFIHPRLRNVLYSCL